MGIAAKRIGVKISPSAIDTPRIKGIRLPPAYVTTTIIPGTTAHFFRFQNPYAETRERRTQRVGINPPNFHVYPDELLSKTGRRLLRARALCAPVRMFPSC
jgi:hypothetical protein